MQIPSEVIVALLTFAGTLAGKWGYDKYRNGTMPVTSNQCQTQHKALEKLLDERNETVKGDIKEMKESQKEAFSKIDHIHKHLMMENK